MSESQIYFIEDFDLKNRVVFIRTDFNIPVVDDQVVDHIRLQSALPTLKYALKQQARVVIGSHRGRPKKGEESKYTLEPFGYYLGRKLGSEVVFIEDTDTPIPSVLLASLNEKKIILLENLRFHPGEESGSLDWAQRQASYIDVYINEAFSVSHRGHTSVGALPLQVKERGEGFSMRKEREILDYIRQDAPSPLMLLIGGVKVSDKIKAVARLVDRLDSILIGGVMAYTFLKAQGVATGEAYIQDESLKLAEDFIERLRVRGKKLFLPIDHLIVPDRKQAPRAGKIEKPEITSGPEVPKGTIPMDIGPKTVELFSKVLRGAQTVFWNGPVGKFEEPLFAKGTLGICEALAGLDQTFKVVGGGDSIAAVLQSGKQGCFNYISTGGGASLKYLEQGSLPGLKNLEMSKSPIKPLDLEE